MLSVIRRAGLFWILYGIFIVCAIILLLRFPKADIHLWINRHYSLPADRFFYFVTFLGNGIFSLVIGLLLLFSGLRQSLVILLSWMVSGLLVQILKVFVFSSVARPLTYFRHLAPLHLVDGVNLYTTQSFPSGHSASAFALFLCLAFFFNKRYLQLFFFLAALAVAYSRMYLSQHFLVDVAGGSVLGMAVASAFLYLFTVTWSTRIPDKPVYAWRRK